MSCEGRERGQGGREGGCLGQKEGNSRDREQRVSGTERERRVAGVLLFGRHLVRLVLAEAGMTQAVVGS